MTFYEIGVFVLSISTLLLMYLLRRGLDNYSMFATIVVITYMAITMYVFVFGLWEIIFKI